MGLSKLFQCLRCGSAPRDDSGKATQQHTPRKSTPQHGSAPERSKHNNEILHTPLRTSPRQLSPSEAHSEPRDGSAPSISRASSLARLSLPLEFVSPEAISKEDSEKSENILGRKSSYTVISSADQPKVEALERSAGSFRGPPTPLQGLPAAEEALAIGAEAVAGAAASVGVVLHTSTSHYSISPSGSGTSSLPGSAPATVTAPPTPSKPRFEIGSPAVQSSLSRSSESYHSGSSVSELDAPATRESMSPITHSEPLLGPIRPELKGRKCLVLDLDETLVHSSFKYIPDADFLIPVNIDGRVHNVFVCKRPGVDEFLKRVGELFEVVVFTASVSKYGDPLLNHLDKDNVIHHRLFRESCYNYNGNYIKNLSMLGRPLKDVIIIDNSPASYALQPQHAVPVSTWFSDIHDNELLDMLPLLSDLVTRDVPDVSDVLDIEIHK